MKSQGQAAAGLAQAESGITGKLKYVGSLSPRAIGSHGRILSRGESYKNGSEYQQCLWPQRGTKVGPFVGRAAGLCSSKPHPIKRWHPGCPMPTPTPSPEIALLELGQRHDPQALPGPWGWGGAD